jgi:sulfur-carrier protein
MPHAFIPPLMRSFTNGQESVEVDGESVADVINNLDQQFPGIREKLCQNDSLRPGISVSVGGSVATLGMLQRTAPDAEIHFLPAIGGG